MNKAEYVRSQSQTRDHHCHWPGCTMQVPPAMWGCTRHWFALPKHLRDLIWRTFVPGQEVDATPSDAYIDAAERVQLWIREEAPAKLHAPPASSPARPPTPAPAAQQLELAGFTSRSSL